MGVNWGKMTTAHRKWEKEGREGGMKSNIPWETVGFTNTHTHTHRHEMRQVGSVVKGHIRKL